MKFCFRTLLCVVLTILYSILDLGRVSISTPSESTLQPEIQDHVPVKHKQEEQNRNDVEPQKHINTFRVRRGRAYSVAILESLGTTNRGIRTSSLRT